MCGSESNRPVMIPTVPGKAGMVVEMPIADAVTPVRRVLGFVQNRTLRRACVILIDQGFRSGATFLTGVFVARYCSMAEHGLFFLGFTVILLMANVQETLIASPLYVFLPARRGRFREEYQQCATILQGGLALSGTLMIIMIGWVAYMLGSHLGRFLVFISPVGAAVMVRDYVRQSYFAQLRPVRALGVDIPVAILQVGAIGLLGHYGRLEGAEALYILGGVALLVCLVPFARSMRIRRVIRRHYLLRVLRKHVAFGRWMLASRAAYWVGIGGYPFLLTMTVGAADAGIFGACQRLPLLFGPILAGAINFLLPTLSHRIQRDGEAAGRALVGRATALVAVGMFSLCLVVLLYGSELLSFLYGVRYVDYTLCLSILTIAVAIHNLSFCIGIGFVASRRPWVDLSVYGMAGMVTLTLGWLLSSRAGVVGASVGYLLATSVATIARYIWFIRDK